MLLEAGRLRQEQARVLARQSLGPPGDLWLPAVVAQEERILNQEHAEEELAAAAAAGPGLGVVAGAVDEPVDALIEAQAAGDAADVGHVAVADVVVAADVVELASGHEEPAPEPVRA